MRVVCIDDDGRVDSYASRPHSGDGDGVVMKASIGTGNKIRGACLARVSHFEICVVIIIIHDPYINEVQWQFFSRIKEFFLCGRYFRRKLRLQARGILCTRASSCAH